jgi:hypothetical protein
MSPNRGCWQSHFQGHGLGGKLWKLLAVRVIQSGSHLKSQCQKPRVRASGPVVQAHGIAFQPMQLSLFQNAA